MEEEDETDVKLRMDARSDGGGGAVRRNAGGGETVAVGATGRAGSFGGIRRAIAFSQSWEMSAVVVGLICFFS